MRPDRIKSVSCIYKQNNEIMGLGFTIHTKIKDIEKFQQAVESQAVESGYNAEHDESSSMVSFCRLGVLFLNYQHEG